MPSSTEMLYTKVTCTESCELKAVAFDTMNNILAV